MHRQRTALERSVRAVSEQTEAADALVDEALKAGLSGSHPVTLHAKMLQLELLNVKTDLERELVQLVLDCSSGGRALLGRWSRCLARTLGPPGPAPHHEPEI